MIKYVLYDRMISGDIVRIGVDIDNVLSNFNEVLLKDYIKHDKELRNKGIVNKNVYIRKMFDWSEEEESTYYKENIERLATLLKPLKDCAKYIKKLREQGNYICIISGRDNGEYSDPYRMTIDWLNQYGIEYDKLILTNAYRHQEKADLCLKHDIDIMIDDSIHVCEKCFETGKVKPLLFDTIYNKYEARFKRVANWKEIFDYINHGEIEKINVILDTDTYNECDDQFALAYMIKNQERFHIEAITIAPYSSKRKKETVISGQTKSYHEILKICNWLNFDTNNKVFHGAEGYISSGYEKESAAVKKIIEVALQNDKTYILAIGAITNVALAITKEPKIIDKIEVIWLGGHSLLQDDNMEFNFRQDVDAVRIVFDSKVKLTVIPCKNVASNLRTTLYELNHYLKDQSELCNYLIDRFYYEEYHGLQERRVIWDISVIAYMINKDWFTSMEISCPKINDDTSYKLTTNRHKITMVNYIDVDKVYTDLFGKLRK